MKFWLVSSLVFAALFAVPALREAFADRYVVQDDARQHVFWMQRFVDPELFPNDVLAEYFRSASPIGYVALHWLAAQVGVDPLVLNKLLPLVLGVVASGFVFALTLEMLPVPAAGFLAVLLLNQSLWLKDDLVSATPRAFFYPLFLAFGYALLRRSWPACLALILLQGLVYPQGVLVSAGVLVLGLVRWEDGRLRVTGDRRAYRFCASGLAAALLVLLLYARTSSEFGPIITADEASTLPAFMPGGRMAFFTGDPWEYWISGWRSGLLPAHLFRALPLWAGLVLPLVLLDRSRFPLAERITPAVGLLGRITLASLGMFFAAHALLFRLYLPNRYTEHTFRMLLAPAAAIALTVLADAVLRWTELHAGDRRRWRQALVRGVAAILAIALLVSPVFVQPFPDTAYKVGRAPALYEFFSRQPKDVLIASLANEADDLTTFSARSVLVAREYAIPFHVGYERLFRQRTLDMIRAQYSSDPADVRELVEAYDVDFLLLDRAAFTPEYVERHPWIGRHPYVEEEVLSRLRRGDVPALAGLVAACSAFAFGHLIVVDARCAARMAGKDPG